MAYFYSATLVCFYAALDTAALYDKAEGAQSSNAVITEMQRAAMHVRNISPGSLGQAKAIFRSQQRFLARMRDKSPELQIWVNYAQGLIQMYSGDAQDAAVTFRQGLHTAEVLPQFN